jgi:hypothetical protein
MIGLSVRLGLTAISIGYDFAAGGDSSVLMSATTGYPACIVALRGKPLSDSPKENPVCGMLLVNSFEGIGPRT